MNHKHKIEQQKRKWSWINNHFLGVSFIFDLLAFEVEGKLPILSGLLFDPFSIYLSKSDIEIFEMLWFTRKGLFDLLFGKTFPIFETLWYAVCLLYLFFPPANSSFNFLFSFASVFLYCYNLDVIFYFDNSLQMNYPLAYSNNYLYHPISTK